MMITTKKIIDHDIATELFVDIIPESEFKSIKKFIPSGRPNDNCFNGFIGQFIKSKDSEAIGIELFAGSESLIARHTAKVNTVFSDFKLDRNLLGIRIAKDTKDFQSCFNTHLINIFNSAKDNSIDYFRITDKPDLDTWDIGNIKMVNKDIIVNAKELLCLEYDYWLNLDFLKKMFNYCGSQIKVYQPKDSISPVVFETAYKECIAMPVK